VSRISNDEQNRATNSGSRHGAHGAAKAIKAVPGITAGETHPRVGRRVISHGGYFFLQTIIPSRELHTFVDDNSEPLTARATPNKCEVGMARK